MHSAHLAIVEVDHLGENEFLKDEINTRRYESGKWKRFKGFAFNMLSKL